MRRRWLPCSDETPNVSTSRCEVYHLKEFIAKLGPHLAFVLIQGLYLASITGICYVVEGGD